MARPLILLVDDDPGLRAAIAFALDAEGFEVASFATAGEALAVTGKTIACAVLDHRPPAVDGLALLAHLRMRAEGLPAVVVTSNASKQVRGKIALMNAILVEKPLLGEAMVETIRSAAADGTEAARP